MTVLGRLIPGERSQSAVVPEDGDDAISAG